jgi:hypothetical protein
MRTAAWIVAVEQTRFMHVYRSTHLSLFFHILCRKIRKIGENALLSWASTSVMTSFSPLASPFDVAASFVQLQLFTPL